MATILFAAAGAAIGAGFGGTVLGLSGAVIGRAVGATVGRSIDQRILGIGSDAVEVGKLDRFHVMGASEGTPIAKIWGRMRLPGQVIWASPFEESSRKSGGKGMPSPKTVQYSYSVSLALALCEGEILGIGRIWADGDEIAPNSLNMRVYMGTEEQLPDPRIEVQVGQGLAPAYRGTAYVVLEDLQLSVYGNRVPQFSFEVMRRAQGPEAEKVSDLQDVIKGVALIPGTGEYALATQKIREQISFGNIPAINVNAPSGDTDLVTSLNQLRQELPNCKAVSLVVSWFGSDLRCGTCDIQPMVERKDSTISQMPWRAGGVGRNEAQEIARLDGRSIYGGTPADATVIEAITLLRSTGQAVMFYPFILMDQLKGNTKPDPYSTNQFQPALPWRGRITLSTAPGRAGSPDQTETASAEVATFFGGAEVGDFSVHGGEIFYHGEEKWAYRRFILHYAHLCNLAGGVESFCIGSELRGLTQVRGQNHTFPAVEALLRLATDVRSILGPEVKISYAADWSEYFGYHTENNVYFHLDPLWASADIDFVGIDNYMPISDWRNAPDHEDKTWGSIYNLDYLASNIMGGEGFDWYYQSFEGMRAQKRVAIQDSAHGEDWVFRYKDLASWWSNLHYNRVDGIRQPEPTSWIPQSKPFRFTEFGCAAIDKGTNEPNKFIDPLSSESSVPRDSLAVRDDYIQMQYFRAMHLFWNTQGSNPFSEVYVGQMVDLDRCYAWAWDARPYPEFPRNTDVWSDGENYYRGHWLNGRVTSAPLDRTILEIAGDSGLAAVDACSAHGVIHGYCASANFTGRAKLQPLTVTYAFDCFEGEGRLRFQSRGMQETLAISNFNSVVNSSQSGTIEIIHGSDAERPTRARLSYVTADDSFNVSVAESITPDAQSPAVVEAEYPIVLPAELANETSKRWLSEILLARDQISANLPLSAMSEVLNKSISFAGTTYRVDHFEIDGTIFVRGVRFEPSFHKRIYQGIDRRGWVNHVSLGPVDYLWLDLPLIEANQSPSAPFLALAATPWRGPAVVWSSNEDFNYLLDSQIDSPSSLGVTLSDLHACSSAVLDRGPPLLVEMMTTNLDSASAEGLLSGRNLIAIGGSEPETWELFQFMKAHLVSPRVYSLSKRLRGRFGSDAHTPSVWPAGSNVVLIDANLRQVGLKSDQINLDRHYRIGFDTEGVGSETVRYERRAFSGSGFRPLSIVHLCYTVDSEGDHLFKWMRRTRSGGDPWTGFDVPLSEDRECYLFIVKSLDGEVKMRQFVTTNSFIYDITKRVMDGVFSSYRVDVAQVSSIYGVGPSKSCLVL